MNARLYQGNFGAYPFPNNLSNIFLAPRSVSLKFGDSQHWERAEALWGPCDGNLLYGNSISLKRRSVLERQHENYSVSWQTAQSERGASVHNASHKPKFVYLVQPRCMRIAMQTRQSKRDTLQFDIHS